MYRRRAARMPRPAPARPWSCPAPTRRRPKNRSHPHRRSSPSARTRSSQRALLPSCQIQPAARTGRTTRPPSLHHLSMSPLRPAEPPPRPSFRVLRLSRKLQWSPRTFRAIAATFPRRPLGHRLTSPLQAVRKPTRRARPHMLRRSARNRRVRSLRRRPPNTLHRRRACRLSSRHRRFSRQRRLLNLPGAQQRPAPPAPGDVGDRRDRGSGRRRPCARPDLGLGSAEGAAFLATAAGRPGRTDRRSARSQGAARL